MRLRKERHIPALSTIPMDYVEKIMCIFTEEQSVFRIETREREPASWAYNPGT